MASETTKATWTGSEFADDWISDNRSTAKSGRPIVVAGQPRGIVEQLEAEFVWRGWVPLLVDGLDDVPALVERAFPAAVVVPLILATMGDGRFCTNLRERSPDAYLPIVAYDENIGPVRTFAWNAGCDEFIPHSVGAIALCRELARLIDIAAEITRRLFGGSRSGRSDLR